MKKSAKIPGDVLKVMRSVDNQQLIVNINGYPTPMNRKQYNELMKCTLFYFNPEGIPEGDCPPSGFYLVDKKTSTATYKWLCIMKPSQLTVKVNDREFKVNNPWKGWKYQ